MFYCVENYKDNKMVKLSRSHYTVLKSKNNHVGNILNPISVFVDKI